LKFFKIIDRAQDGQISLQLVVNAFWEAKRNRSEEYDAEIPKRIVRMLYLISSSYETGEFARQRLTTTAFLSKAPWYTFLSRKKSGSFGSSYVFLSSPPQRQPRERNGETV
jgi:hypothetical protein